MSIKTQQGSQIRGTLFLLPSTLGPGNPGDTLPAANLHIMQSLRHFIVEDFRSARRMLRSVGFTGPLDDELFMELNEHTPDEAIPDLLLPLVQGYDVGLMSDAGLPCVADPGSRVVIEAQRLGIRVRPLTGPSSILLALMASGLNGQGFHFHGYLPVKPNELKNALKQLEREALSSGHTQIFIEAPYRNQRMLVEILATCHPDTLLCLGAELTTEKEWVLTRTIQQWKSSPPDIQKRNVVFLLGMNPG